ncbi:hypothetical protein J4417_05825 [Candidatus Woesearchaeota archaeon]|nr:hypothetical protein [Candidatus Woesearchaeota archaeon]
MDLSKYNNQTINFGFEVHDTFTFDTLRKPSICQVDTIKPVITSFNHRLEKTALYLNVTLSEQAATIHLVENRFQDNEDKTKLCTKCQSYGFDKSKKRLLSKGNHRFRIVATDYAGNQVESEMFTVSV